MYNVPTNEELRANAPAQIHTAVRNWLARHTRPQMHNASWTREELDWAANNLLHDPEIIGAYEKEVGEEWPI